METFSILDGRKYFYQWDTNRKIRVNDESITEVHFCNGTSDCSLVVEVKDGAANVPNILLQSARSIRVYAVQDDHTCVESVFAVRPRTKPADYVYTETEVKRYEDLEKQIEEVRKSIPSVPVQSVNGKTGEVQLTPSDVGAQPAGDYALRSEIPSVPVKSVNGKTGDVQLTHSDVGAQPAGDYALRSEIPSVPVKSVNGKTGDVQLTPSDVGAQPAGDYALRSETLAKASAINCEISGSEIIVTDATAQPAVQLISHIEPVQEGEGAPSPNNVRPIIGRERVNITNYTSEQTLTADLPKTVYCGMLDWSAGLLTVYDYVFVTFDGTEEIIAVDSSGFNTQVFTCDDKKVDNKAHFNTKYGIYSNMFMRSNNMAFAHLLQNEFYWTLAGAWRFGWGEPGTTAEEFKAFLQSNPLQILIPLSNEKSLEVNKETYLLTPQRMDMLKADNYIGSNTGNTDLIYVADTKLYIDRKYDELQAAILSQGSNV